MEKLLIVEDEQETVDFLKENLQAHGYEVLTAQDGNSALQIARQELPRVILLDLMLPGLDGYRVLKLLKSDTRYRGISIVVVTARCEPEDLTLALECGADGYLIKPIHMEALLERIQTLCRKGNGNGHAHSL